MLNVYYFNYNLFAYIGFLVMTGLREISHYCKFGRCVRQATSFFVQLHSYVLQLELTVAAVKVN
jgi:hypothetical protein